MNKSIIDKSSIDAMVLFLETVKADFTLNISNYTASLICESLGQRYMKSFKSKSCFIAYQKIKKEVSTFSKPKINEDKLQYFSHDIKKSFFVQKAIQIDIRSAYATVLLNGGYISNDTFDYISNLNKGDRLAAIGMLASIKYSFRYHRGEVVETKIIENKLKNFFFFCVKEVQDIMRVCKMQAINCYMLIWVDAIYIVYNERVCREIVSILDANGLKCSTETIYNFNCSCLDSKIKISLDSRSGHKEFFIPSMKNYVSASLYDSIMKKSQERLTYKSKLKN